MMKKTFLSKTFLWMALGLLITFITGILVATNETLLYFVFGTISPWVWFIAEIVIALVISARIHSLKSNTVKLLYCLYAMITGLTFSGIFIIYEVSSIIFIFLIASILFGIFAFVGKVTDLDLAKFGTYLFMFLIGVLVLEIINIFIMNNTLDIITCIIALMVFLGYTSYDIQRVIRNDYDYANDNMAIYWALQLYLDFINILLRLLELFGKSRD